MPIFLRLSSVAALLFFIFMLWIIVISDAGMPNVFIDSVRAIPYGDKLGHVGLYAILAGLLNFSLESRGRKHLGLPLGCALVLLFALLEELSQGFFPGTRTLDIGDAAADFVGIYFSAWVDVKFLRNLKSTRS